MTSILASWRPATSLNLTPRPSILSTLRYLALACNKRMEIKRLIWTLTRLEWLIRDVRLLVQHQWGGRIGSTNINNYLYGFLLSIKPEQLYLNIIYIKVIMTILWCYLRNWIPPRADNLQKCLMGWIWSFAWIHAGGTQVQQSPLEWWRVRA